MKKTLNLRNQRGVSLAITLILISVMLVVGTTAMRLSGNIQAMAGNSRDYEIAYQAAEVALKACELRMQLQKVKDPNAANSDGYSGTHNYVILPQDPYDPITNPKYYWERGTSFWNDGANTNVYLGPLTDPELKGVSRQPRCILENYQIPPDNTQENVELTPAYRITSKGFGARGNGADSVSKVYLQAIVRL